ncbi:hypothetical protein HDU86_000137 [Geranomyces michiganensis]|nr:hypothetical protein HDU86_000137 [Geranomyces michiganensis]
MIVAHGYEEELINSTDHTDQLFLISAPDGQVLTVRTLGQEAPCVTFTIKPSGAIDVVVAPTRECTEARVPILFSSSSGIPVATAASSLSSESMSAFLTPSIGAPIKYLVPEIKRHRDEVTIIGLRLKMSPPDLRFHPEFAGKDINNVTNNLDLIQAIHNIEVEDWRRSAIVTLKTSLSIETTNLSARGTRFGNLPWQTTLLTFFRRMIDDLGQEAQFRIRIEFRNYETNAMSLADAWAVYKASRR